MVTVKGRVMCRESFRSQKSTKALSQSCLSADNVTICLAFRDLSALLSFPSPEADNARAEKSEADLRPRIQLIQQAGCPSSRKSFLQAALGQHRIPSRTWSYPSAQFRGLRRAAFLHCGEKFPGRPFFGAVPFLIQNHPRGALGTTRGCSSDAPTWLSKGAMLAFLLVHLELSICAIPRATPSRLSPLR